MWFVMSRKCSDQFYYAVRIGRKPGIYRGWYGEYGAENKLQAYGITIIRPVI